MILRGKGLYLLVVFLGIIASTAHAKVYIDLSAPAGKRLPVAVEEFVPMGGNPGGTDDPEGLERVRHELRDTIVSDLIFSDFFDVIDPSAHLVSPLEEGFSGKEIDFKNWRTIGAELLIKGRFEKKGDSLTVEAKLFDTIKEKLIIGRRYKGRAGNPRRLAHMFSNDLIKELSGLKGIFTTKILFVSDRTGSKEIYISDYDGRNVRQITNNRSINLSPRWSPDGKRIIYTSYKKGWPCLYLLDLKTGRERTISDRPGINIGGRFSPDGKRIALTLSGEKSPEIYILDLITGEYIRLTNNYAIDVSPEWSPDGKKIVFVSDMAGNPHLYVIDSDGNNLKRLTYDGKYNASPSWSPDGKFIAFTRRDEGNFNIWVMHADGTGQVQLTYEGNNKSPSWSPDGRYIVFNSVRDGTNSSLYLIRADGTGLRKITTDSNNEKNPAWSPYLD